jgi:uncharacterized protein (DUF58 family)
MPSERPRELAELLKEVRRVTVLSDRLVDGALAGNYSSVFRGAGIEFDEVREYVEGDDPRAIDWGVTARIGRPFVKKYVDERELTVVFVLDLSPSMEAGFGPLSARRMAARVAACLALSAVRNHDRVGLVAFGDSVERYVPPSTGRAHALRVVRDCLALPASAATGGGVGRGSGLARAIDFTARVLHRRAVVFALSDFLGDGWRDAFRHCARRHDLVAVRLVAPELAPGGLERLAPLRLVKLRDPESGATALVDLGHAPARAELAARIARWRARTEEELRRISVDRVDVPLPRQAGADTVVRPLLGFFRMRELRGAKR